MLVIINNFNRLTTTKALVDYLLQVDEAEPVIIDNASTLMAVREWYRSECPVQVLEMDNLGPRAPWSPRLPLWFRRRMEGERYVVTDSDLDLSEVPLDLLRVLEEGLDQWHVIKCGLSLEIEDIPDSYPYRDQVRAHEARWWREKWGDYWYANIDTTFALYRPGHQFDYGPALRADRPYTARHVPWYLNFDNLSVEERKVIESSRHLNALGHTSRHRRSLR